MAGAAAANNNNNKRGTLLVAPTIPTLLGEEQHESDVRFLDGPLPVLCGTMLFDVVRLNPQYLARNNTKMTFVSLMAEHPSATKRMWRLFQRLGENLRSHKKSKERDQRIETGFRNVF